MWCWILKYEKYIDVKMIEYEIKIKIIIFDLKYSLFWQKFEIFNYRNI